MYFTPMAQSYAKPGGLGRFGDGIHYRQPRRFARSAPAVIGRGGVARSRLALSGAGRRRGVGDAFQQQVNTGASIAQSGAAVTAALLVQFGAVTGPVGALIGAAAAGLVMVGSMIAKAFEGCGDTCVEATNIANEVSDYLVQNLQAYQASPVRYRSIQAAALNNVDTALAALRQGCSNPALGAAGQRCISERLIKGGTAPWCPNPGNTGCDWITLYRDPIANDPTVVADPLGSSLLSSVGLNPSATIAGIKLSDLLLPAALLLTAAVL